MTKEEAIAKGIPWHDTIHSMKRRSPWHDYSAKGIYMVTLVVDGRKPMLGKLVEKNSIIKVELSELGKSIMNEEVQKISKFYPMVEVWKVCIMPDHIHMILRVREEMPDKKHLGSVIRGFKTGCSRAWWRINPLGYAKGTEAGSVSSVSPEEIKRPVLFEPGYNDKILLREGQLKNWKKYLDDNPRRLWMKRNNPDLFTVLHDMDIADHKCQIVGNRFLLNIPDKVAVIVHRRYTDEEVSKLRDEWLDCGERGGVLVSAAISQMEKLVLREAMNRGYKIILLKENGFPDLYKPTGESFDACLNGQLLQISPWDYHMEKKNITRDQCLELNEMAEKIVDDTFN